MQGKRRTCTAAWNFARALNGFDCRFDVVLRSCVVAFPLVIHYMSAEHNSAERVQRRRDRKRRADRIRADRIRADRMRADRISKENGRRTG